MASNYPTTKTYDVDIVLCIDCTESMDNILNIVKERALGFYGDIDQSMRAKDKHIDQLRVRVVAFRGYQAYEDELQKRSHLNEPMLVTDFFHLPEEAYKLEASVRSLQPVGGGDDPEDGLEALAYAIRSDWDVEAAATHRHLIVLWTDQPPHELGFGKRSSRYPRGMARDMDELTEWWGDSAARGCMPRQSAKRLILFAPDEGAWTTIFDTWDNVLHLPSRAGDHLRDVDYEMILKSISQSIG